MCPECGGEARVYEYDFGRCSETGYHDAGECYRCLDCGQTGDAADVEDCRECAAPRQELLPLPARVAFGSAGSELRVPAGAVSVGPA